MKTVCQINQKSVETMLQIINNGAIEGGCRLSGNLHSGFRYEGNIHYARAANTLLNSVVSDPYDSEIALEWLYDYMQSRDRVLMAMES